MNTTGIIRRIDELGRIVIPKEMRRTLRLAVGDEMEIGVVSGGLVLRKFSEIENMDKVAKDIVYALREFTKAEIFLCDLDNIVLAEGSLKKKAQGRSISYELENKIRARDFVVLTESERISLYDNDDMEMKTQVIAPIVACGDVVGGLLLMTDNDGQELAPLVNLAVKILVPICTK